MKTWRVRYESIECGKLSEKIFGPYRWEWQAWIVAWLLITVLDNGLGLATVEWRNNRWEKRAS